MLERVTEDSLEVKVEIVLYKNILLYLKRLKMQTDKIPLEPDHIEILIDELVNWISFGFLCLEKKKSMIKLLE